MNRELLEQPFPSELIKTRKGNFGNELSYVEAPVYIERLNQVFDGDWSFEIGSHEIMEAEVLVLGKLKADGVVKMQFGGSQITRNKKTGEPISLADDIKAAATDGLKKCASLLGLGLHLYGGNGEKEKAKVYAKSSSKGNGSRRKDSGNGDGGNEEGRESKSSPGNGNGNGERLTNRQLKAIFAIGRNLDMTQKDIRSLSVKAYGKTPQFLSKEEASFLISDLQEEETAVN